MVDELGFSNFYGANFEPKYAYFKINIDKKPYVCIQVEIPGECKVSCSAKYVDNYLHITVKGFKYLTLEDKKKNDKKSDGKTKEEAEEKDKDLSFNKREEGDFKLLIKLNPEYYDLKENYPDKNLTKRTKGLYRFYFPLKDDYIESDGED